MLKIIANALLFLFLTVNAYAGSGAIGLMMGTGTTAAPASACTTTMVDTVATYSTLQKLGELGGGAENTRIASSFITDGTGGCVCKVVVPLKKTVAVVNGTLSLKIYSGATPTTVVGTSDTTYTDGDLTTSYANKDFLFSSCVNLSALTTYWVSVETDDLTNGAGDYFATVHQNTGTDKVYRYTSTPEWLSVDTSATITATIYK